MNQLASVPLPDNIYWSDEFDWNPVGQVRTYTLTGALVVEETLMQAGRPITLEGAWITRQSVQDLVTLQGAAATAMTLTLDDGRTFNVLFRREGDTPPVEASPLFPGSPSAYTPATLYTLTLRLMEL